MLPVESQLCWQELLYLFDRSLQLQQMRYSDSNTTLLLYSTLNECESTLGL